MCQKHRRCIMTNFLERWQFEVRCPRTLIRGPWPWISDRRLVGLVAGSGSTWFEGWGVCSGCLRLGHPTDDGWVEALPQPKQFQIEISHQEGRVHIRAGGKAGDRPQARPDARPADHRPCCRLYPFADGDCQMPSAPAGGANTSTSNG